jgi:uncharacterized membrane protein
MAKQTRQKYNAPVSRSGLNPVREIVAHQVTRVHEGPLPAPKDLERYDRVHPGAAAIIIQIARDEQDHRYNCDKDDIAYKERQHEVPSFFRSPSSLNHAALSCPSELLTHLSKN